jgi:hypothetical protein
MSLLPVLRLALVAAALGARLPAAPVLLLDQPDQVAVAGGTVGWGFTLKSDPNEWITFYGSFVLTETNSSLGTFDGFLALQQGPVNGLVPAGHPDWVVPFDLATMTGVGVYQLNTPLAPGARTEGVIRGLYNRFRSNPLFCQDPSCYLGNGTVDVAFSITIVDAAVPEPGTAALAGAAIVALASLRRYRG